MSRERWTCWNGHRWRDVSRECACARILRKGVGRLNGLRVAVHHANSPDERWRLYDPAGAPVVDFVTVDSLVDYVSNVTASGDRSSADLCRSE